MDDVIRLIGLILLMQKGEGRRKKKEEEAFHFHHQSVLSLDGLVGVRFLSFPFFGSRISRADVPGSWLCRVRD